MVVGRQMRMRREATSCLREFCGDEQAATSIEYAIIAAGIGSVIVTAVYTLGDTVLANYYTRIAEAVASVGGPP